MSLATRCPKCNTVFQVNKEQLKRYSGVVRCGVCHNPFNGIDHLISRLSRSESDNSTSKTEKSSAAALIPSEGDSISPDMQERPFSVITSPSNLAQLSEEIDEDNDNTTQIDVINTQEAALKESFEKQIQSINFDLNLSSLDDDKPVLSVSHEEISTTDNNSGQPEAVTSYSINDEAEKREPFLPPDSTKSQFEPAIIADVPKDIIEKPATVDELLTIVGKKKKRSFFSQLLWSMGSLLLLVLLGLQGIYQYSEEIMAWWPPAEELVHTTCELLSCPVNAPIKKTALSIAVTAPEKLENLPDQYAQDMTITNNSPNMQFWPALVMELTDVDNKVLLRRTFQPEEYLPEESGTTKGLAPASDITFTITFEFAHHSTLKSRVFLLDNP